jgi:hypothetical protein
MTGTIRDSANDILNQVGVEVGLDPVTDPWSSNDQNYRQLRYLINTAGEELSQLFPWEFLRKEQTFTTTALDTGNYDLPDDFLYLINQTGWDRTNQSPLGGPLSPQAWQYLEASNSGSTLLVYYRIKGDQFCLNPQPPDAGIDIAYEYISRNWVLDSTTGTTYRDSIATGADEPLFNRTLLSRMLKVKYLEAKGFDTSKAQADLNQAFGLLTARNRGAPILNTKVGARNYPLLGGQSVPDTGYGS